MQIFFKDLLDRFVADYRHPSSLANRLRRRRVALFNDLLRGLPRPLTILDVGGSAIFWNTLGIPSGDVTIILLNSHRSHIANDKFKAIVGDARDLRQFADCSIDVLFSNSVIEHVGGRADQIAMAEEVKRVAKRYFIQTPNKYFPVEPHFLVPCFQFLPIELRTRLLMTTRLGFIAKEPDYDRAKEKVLSVKLLSNSDFRSLFKGATFYEERFMGIVKSMVAYKGWQ